MGRFCLIVLTAAWLVVAKADATDDVTEPPCADSEILDKCPVDCPSDYCPTSRCDDQSSCPKPASADCPAPACKCRFNYRRATNGTCIPTRECPPFDCDGDNEEYNPCPPLCPGESCSQATEDGECHRVGRIGIVLPCKPACRCKKYFWRQDGVCVPYEQCIPSCTRPHEKHAFVMDCPPERSCKNRGIEFSCLADQKREQKCVCDEGYVRNESNECIEEENCDKCSEPNEEYTDCKRTCPPELCISIIALFNCKADEPCEAGCACKPGHYRQQNNTSCIPACQCQEMAGTTECRATIEQ